MWLESLSIIVFLGIIGFLIYKDRKNIEFKYILLIRRTNKGKKWIRKTAKKLKKPLRIYANIGIAIAIIASVIGMIFLFKNLTVGEPGVKFLLPKIFPGEPSEGVQKHVSFIPIWYWIITIFIIIVPHELSHGLVAVTEKIKIKSLGVMLFLIFPGAFVEPNEKQFKNSKPLTRMRVAAVGSFANFIVFILLIIVIFGMTLLSNQIFVENGVIFSSTIEETPADYAGLEGTITHINQKEVKNLVDFVKILDSVKPNEEITIVTTEGEFNIVTIENPDYEGESFIGISDVKTNLKYKNSLEFLGNPNFGVAIFFWLYSLLNWAAFLDINIAIANLLPFLPFDGGIIYQAIFEKIFKKETAKKMITTLSVIVYLILILNIIGMNSLLNLI